MEELRRDVSLSFDFSSNLFGQRQKKLRSDFLSSSWNRLDFGSNERFSARKLPVTISIRTTKNKPMDQRSSMKTFVSFVVLRLPLKLSRSPVVQDSDNDDVDSRVDS